MEKVIPLNGRIDTTNALKVEEDINKEIENFDGDLVLDADGLEYISSAGLRIIMRLKKKLDALKVINCSLELYEIFHMTGFTQMMDITKKMREISVDGCEVIGTGFYGNVYRIDSETIVKVYRKGVSVEDIKHEIEISRKAFILGIPTAIPYDIVRVGDMYGAVFELINANSLQELIVGGADVDKLVKETVDVLKIIHSTKVEDGTFPIHLKEKIKQVNDCSKFLPDDVCKKLISLMENLPKNNTLVHGDFHIKNIMKQNDEIILVDMNTMSIGHPIFELGAMYATYIGFASVDKDNTEKFLGISLEKSERILELTYQYYFEGKSKEFIDDVISKAKILCYLQILWIRSSFMDKDNPMHAKDIEFAKNYLIENVNKIDSLDF